MHLGTHAIIGGKYRLEAPLSRGGMGSVWVARHIQLGAAVAVKLMDPAHAASPEHRTRFAREAQAAAGILSPHVVRVQDYGVEGDTPYLVMELLHGEDLHDRLERRRRLSLPEIGDIFAQIGKGLRRAHEAGIVHRDLKPRNIYLARLDDEEIVKILDFGIAKHTGVDLSGETTRTGELLGTPQYMSPEHLRADRALDPRSDIWSLGVILFRALTGQLPFDGVVMSTVMVKILVDPIPLASQIALDLPVSLDSFFARALARDRDQRFSSVQEMARELSRIVAEASPSSSPAQSSLSSMALSTPLPGALHPGIGFAPASAPPPPPLPPSPETLTTTLAEVGALRPRPRRGLLVAIAALVMGGAGIAALAALRAGDPGTPPAAAPPPATAEVSAPATAPPPAVEVTPAGEAPSPDATYDARGSKDAAEKPAPSSTTARTGQAPSAAVRAASTKSTKAGAAPAASSRAKPAGSSDARPTWGF